MIARLSIFVFLALVAVFGVSACSGDNEDTPTGLPIVNYEKYDWDIYFLWQMDMADKASDFTVWAVYLNDPLDLAPNDAYYVNLGGENIRLWEDEAGFYLASHIILNPGQSYTVKFIQNETVLSTSSIRMPYKATVSFPNYYYPSTAATINWSMQKSNQYQYAGVYAKNSNTEAISSYGVILKNSARSCNIPADVVEDMNPTSYHVLYLSQYNFAPKNRFAFSAFHHTVAYYGSGKEEISPRERLELARKIRAGH